jgi:hypothetical protein
VRANPPERSTSHAKTADLEQQQTALDRALALKEEFNRAKAAAERALEQQKAVQASKENQSSHAPVPEQHLRPEGEIRRLVDKQIDEEKQQKENDRSRSISEEYKELAKQQQDRDLELQKDQDRSR